MEEVNTQLPDQYSFEIKKGNEVNSEEEKHPI